MERAHALGDPDDWASFQSDLADALAAAFALNHTSPLAENRGEHDRQIRSRLLDLLDGIRIRHRPARDWDGFFNAPWTERRQIRDDL